MPSLRALFFATTLAVSAVAPLAHAEGNGSTTTFPYKQKTYLYSRNASGGLAYVTPGATRGATLPVVVFLHGMNAGGDVHMWFGPPYGDLRVVADALVSSGKVEPFVLAAPTHTRFATGATVMWHDFDLTDFLDATQSALGEAARLDRSRVIVVGHSGAGCNPTGGIFAEGVTTAKAVLAVDTCLDEKTTPALAQLAKKTQVNFYWQRTWRRPVELLEQACPTCTASEVVDLGGAPHDAILPEALKRALPELLPR